MSCVWETCLQGSKLTFGGIQGRLQCSVACVHALSLCLLTGCHSIIFCMQTFDLQNHRLTFTYWQKEMSDDWTTWIRSSSIRPGASHTAASCCRHAVQFTVENDVGRPIMWWIEFQPSDHAKASSYQPTMNSSCWIWVGMIVDCWIVQNHLNPLWAAPVDHILFSMDHALTLWIAAVGSETEWLWIVGSCKIISTHCEPHLWTTYYFWWTAPWLCGPSDRSTVHRWLFLKFFKVFWLDFCFDFCLKNKKKICIKFFKNYLLFWFLNS